MSLTDILSKLRDPDLQSKKWPIPVLCCILVISVAWISYSLMSGNRSFAVSPTVVLSAAETEAQQATHTLQEDERFQFLSIVPDPENDGGFLVTGYMGSAANRNALAARVRELMGDKPTRIDVETGN